MLFTITEKGPNIPYFMQNIHIYLDLTLVPLAAYFVWPHAARKSKSKSKKTLFNVGQCKQYNISSHLKWVLVADKSMHMVIYNKIHIK